jgi:hypothetical protein
MGWSVARDDPVWKAHLVRIGKMEVRLFGRITRHMMLFARFAAVAGLLAGLPLTSNASATTAALTMRDGGSIELFSQNKATGAVIKKKAMQKKVGIRADRPSPKLNPQPEPPSGSGKRIRQAMMCRKT